MDGWDKVFFSGELPSMPRAGSRGPSRRFRPLLSLPDGDTSAVER